MGNQTIKKASCEKTETKLNLNHDFTLHRNVLSLSLIAAFLKIRFGYSFWLNYHFKTLYNVRCVCDDVCWYLNNHTSSL